MQYYAFLLNENFLVNIEQAPRSDLEEIRKTADYIIIFTNSRAEFQ